MKNVCRFKQKKENYNEQYCKYNYFYYWKFIQITLKCGMKTYSSVDVLFHNFSDLKSIIKTFNVQHKAQLQQYPMPWLIKTWKTIQSLPWYIKQLSAVQSQNFLHSFLKYLNFSEFIREVPYDNILSKPRRLLEPTTKGMCKHSEKEVRGSLDVWEVNNEVTHKQYCCEIQVINLAVLTSWMWYKFA